MIDDLNQVPADVIEQARRLSGFDRRAFLWSRVTHANRAFLDWFTSDVIDGDADVASWGRGRILVPELTLTDLLTRSGADVVGPLDGPGETSWSRIEFDEVYAFPHRHAGAPATVHSDLPYSWSPPPAVTAITLGSAQLRPVDRTDVAVRRWMACRMAGRAATDLGRLTDIDRAASILRIELDALSADARKALHGLVAEVTASAEGVPGFRGPDSLYE